MKLEIKVYNYTQWKIASSTKTWQKIYKEIQDKYNVVINFEWIEVVSTAFLNWLIQNKNLEGNIITNMSPYVDAQISKYFNLTKLNKWN